MPVNFQPYIPQQTDLLTPAMNMVKMKQDQEQMGLLRQMHTQQMNLQLSQETRVQEEYDRKKKMEDMPIYLDDLFSDTQPSEHQAMGITGLSQLGQNTRKAITDIADRMGIVQTNSATGRKFIRNQDYQLAQQNYKGNLDLQKEVAQAHYSDLNMNISNMEQGLAQMMQQSSNKVEKPEMQAKNQQQITQIQQQLSQMKSQRNAVEQALVGYGVKQPTENKYTMENLIAEQVKEGKITIEQGQEMVLKGKNEPAVIDDRRYQDILIKAQTGQPTSNEEKAFVKAYEKRKTLGPIAGASMRIEGLKEIYNEIRQTPVYDSVTGSYSFASANDIRTNPSRYSPPGPTQKTLNQNMLIEDIRGSIKRTKESLTVMPEFTPKQAGQFALVMKSADPAGAMTQFLQSGVGQTLNPQQQDYIINLIQLKEQAMSMRSVLGAGQGSDMMREAIDKTTPSAASPNKAYAGKQLDAFGATLDRIQRFIPNIKPVAGRESPKTPTPTEATETKIINGVTYHKINGQWYK